MGSYNTAAKLQGRWPRGSAIKGRKAQALERLGNSLVSHIFATFIGLPSS
jgi:hypothetical protein